MRLARGRAAPAPAEVAAARVLGLDHEDVVEDVLAPAELLAAAPLPAPTPAPAPAPARAVVQVTDLHVQRLDALLPGAHGLLLLLVVVLVAGVGDLVVDVVLAAAQTVAAAHVSRQLPPPRTALRSRVKTWTQRNAAPAWHQAGPVVTSHGRARTCTTGALPSLASLLPRRCSTRHRSAALSALSLFRSHFCSQRQSS